MKNVTLYAILMLFGLLITSCSSNDDDEIAIENLKNVTDCSLSFSANANEDFVGICLDGTPFALPNETITFASKATPNFSEIVWTVESGSMEILNIENSIEDDEEPGRLKTIATIKFNSDFSGGVIRTDAANDAGETAGMRHFIDLGNNE